MRPNWFIALPVAADEWYAERVAEPPPSLRLFSGRDLHLTLAFLGACGEAGARRAWGLADAWRLGPTSVSLGAVVPMGRRRRYSALSILLERGREAIEDEMGRVRDAWLRAADAKLDARPPKAHITIARPRRKASEEERAAGLAWAEALDLAGVELMLDELVLYTWAEDRRERLFRVVKSRSLYR